MRRYLIIGALCLFGISDAWAIVGGDTSLCSNKTCKNLGYDLAKSVASTKCNDIYFTCPVAGSSCIKCDNIATVGDIKFSSKTSNHDGWLLANGNSGVTLSSTNYPELYSLLNSSTVPNLSGHFLRGIGTGVNAWNVGKSGKNSYRLAEHKHSVTATAHYGHHVRAESGSHEWFEYLATYTLGDANAKGSTTHGVCPVRYALNAFIYAGRKN